jgi:DNA-directed RNA polymerase subunit RPC12/RpoP
MTPPVRIYRCGRCNRAFKPDEERVHSSHSRLSYCTDLDACGRRAKSWMDRPEIRYYAVKP